MNAAKEVIAAKRRRVGRSAVLAGRLPRAGAHQVDVLAFRGSAAGAFRWRASRRGGTIDDMKTATFVLRTGGQDRVHDVTARCEAFAHEASQGGDGLLHVFVPHATAGIAIMELGSGSDDDLLSVLAGLLPADDRWRHAHGSRGHGRSHVLPAFLPPFAVLPVVAGSLALGTWQSVGVVDVNADNPERQVRLSFLASTAQDPAGNSARQDGRR